MQNDHLIKYKNRVILKDEEGISHLMQAKSNRLSMIYHLKRIPTVKRCMMTRNLSNTVILIPYSCKWMERGQYKQQTALENEELRGTQSTGHTQSNPYCQGTTLSSQQQQ